MSARNRSVVTLVATTIVVAMLLGACSSSGSSGKATGHNAQLATLDLAHAAAAPFKAGGSVSQVYVTGAHAGQNLQLVRADGSVVMHAPADAHGSLIFRNVPVAPGYRVAAGSGSTLVASGALGRDVVDLAATGFVLLAEGRSGLRVPAHAGRHHPRDDRQAPRSGEQGPVPDRDRVLRLLARRPEVAPAEHA